MRVRVQGATGTDAPDRSLTHRQELFAQAFALTGNARQSVISAGYSLVRADNRVSEMKRNPAVLERVRELVQIRQQAGAPVAVSYIEDIAAGNFADPRRAAVQLKAATIMSHTAGDEVTQAVRDHVASCLGVTSTTGAAPIE